MAHAATGAGDDLVVRVPGPIPFGPRRPIQPDERRTHGRRDVQRSRVARHHEGGVAHDHGEVGNGGGGRGRGGAVRGTGHLLGQRPFTRSPRDERWQAGPRAQLRRQGTKSLGRPPLVRPRRTGIENHVVPGSTGRRDGGSRGGAGHWMQRQLDCPLRHAERGQDRQVLLDDMGRLARHHRLAVERGRHRLSEVRAIEPDHAGGARQPCPHG